MGRALWLGHPFFIGIGVVAFTLMITCFHITTRSTRETPRKRAPSKVECPILGKPSPPVGLPEQYEVNGHRCRPKYNIGFLKTHRCGSSSIQNILFRFAARHEIFLVLPASGEYISTEPFRVEDVCLVPSYRIGYNMLNLHTRWNHAEVRRILPKDTVYFSVLRDPVGQFLSMFRYLEMDRFVTIEAFASGEIPEQRLSGFFGRNQMLWDFGLSAEELTDERRIRQKIIEIERDFDLLLIADRMDESLVLLRELLCWPPLYMVSMRLNSLMASSELPAGQDTRTRLATWLKGDYMLYNHFYQRFEERVQRFGVNNMRKEVKKLQDETMDWVNMFSL
ncbi:galactose-3-O-sulfotransferase 2-like [Pollicipes pollicipes]|uniref:galactose-3-O-sulfotransferase 2-like n=1 Tax=Pollicipes pollicipes TaxID=41117 RepID=UPI0018853D22|nr:galactose-3-O-sulfotransferase 2-like [Pollicipes pollicipes]